AFAAKRTKAKQYAANAAALETSATRTRGPSFTTLVNSGDLNLYGAATNGVIYLRGKPGVAITALKPGAAIDATTPAESEAFETEFFEGAEIPSPAPGPCPDIPAPHKRLS